MLRSSAKSYGEIREFLNEVPVIDTHEHNLGITEPLNNMFFELFIAQYFISDLQSAGLENATANLLIDNTADFDKRYEIYEKFFKKTCHTGYAAGIKAGLRECWGIKEISKSAFHELEEKMFQRNDTFYKEITERYKIKAAVADVFFLWGMDDFIERKNPRFSELTRFAFSLPSYHKINGISDIMKLKKCLDRSITCLDDYLEAFENCLKKYMDFGIVCIKDQSAYSRSIHYQNPTRYEAEKVFNDILHNPREIIGSKEALALGDWLFHNFMRLASRYELPVQVHTGHLAGIRNNVSRANASNFIPVLEAHPDTMFDLFHGNWPYMDEILFIGKNYPNVRLDLCWVNSIDPLYCIELMKRAVMTMPHSKIFAFGGDTAVIELTVGYLTLARDNVACALSELVDSGWIGMSDARQIAADWFFNNPNEFFKLGFERWEP